LVYDEAVHQGTGTRNMKKLVIAATMIALLPASAYSQQNKGPLTARTEREMKEDKEIDKAYRDAIKRSGGDGQAAKRDPWQTIRPQDTDSANGTKR
jgi:hypothetical protein